MHQSTMYFFASAYARFTRTKSAVRAPAMRRLAILSSLSVCNHTRVTVGSGRLGSRPNTAQHRPKPVQCCHPHPHRIRTQSVPYRSTSAAHEIRSPTHHRMPTGGSEGGERSSGPTDCPRCGSRVLHHKKSLIAKPYFGPTSRITPAAPDESKVVLARYRCFALSFPDAARVRTLCISESESPIRSRALCTNTRKALRNFAT